MSAGDFETAVQRLISQVGHWETTRWHTRAKSGDATRGETVFALVQRLADLTADAAAADSASAAGAAGTGAGRRRPVPRLADTVLPDQLRVMADDLLAAGPPAELLVAVTREVAATRDTL